MENKTPNAKEVSVDTFDELLEILGVPHTKNSAWYNDRKEKVKEWQQTQTPTTQVGIDEDELQILAEKYSSGGGFPKNDESHFKFPNVQMNNWNLCLVIIQSFKDGYKTALQNSTEKRFTLKDIEDALKKGEDIGYDNKHYDKCEECFEYDSSYADKEKAKYIYSLNIK